jgi:hypothetical protein
MSVQSLSFVVAPSAKAEVAVAAPRVLSKLAERLFARITETRGALDGWRAACRASDSWDSATYR